MQWFFKLKGGLIPLFSDILSIPSTELKILPSHIVACINHQMSYFSLGIQVAAYTKRFKC